ncbi:hypothetical protein [Saliterribacillus persicus]|uniref:Uncharacterized protein n=1 Tax=Saliterribacillus persicus TaxID=930114 RepID=A0A368XQ85_9BACI|nr:hypothetical protein [Saliterribacillus persicus]RCW69699.1 hypothetical protein DFR57_10787 [Saliterribacillus persicus]
MRYLTETEWKLASRFLFLSMALQVIKQDLSRLEKEHPFKINEPYVALLHQMEKNATKERQYLRKDMYQMKLQVIPLERKDSFSSYLFICKGKEEKRNYFNPAIRKKVETILEELIHHAFTESAPTNKISP